MNRPEKPARIIEVGAMNTPKPPWRLGLAGLALLNVLGCQVVGGLEELKLAGDATGGGAGSGGNGSGSTGSSSSSVASSSGAPIMGDIACSSVICPVGTESACCFDYYDSKSRCINGPPENDDCNTAGGATGYESRIECQLPSHCPQGTVCCGNLETIAGVATWYATASCATTCTWPDTILCDPATSTDICPMVTVDGTLVQTTCKSTMFLPAGYAVCTN